MTIGIPNDSTTFMGSINTNNLYSSKLRRPLRDIALEIPGQLTKDILDSQIIVSLGECLLSRLSVRSELQLQQEKGFHWTNYNTRFYLYANNLFSNPDGLLTDTICDGVTITVNGDLRHRSIKLLYSKGYSGVKGDRQIYVNVLTEDDESRIVDTEMHWQIENGYIKMISTI